MNIKNIALSLSFITCAALNANDKTDEKTWVNGSTYFSTVLPGGKYGVHVTENKEYDFFQIYDLDNSRSLSTQDGHTSCTELQQSTGMYMVYPVSWCSYLEQYKHPFYAKKAAYFAQQKLAQQKIRRYETIRTLTEVDAERCECPGIVPASDPAISKYLAECNQYQNYLRKLFSTQKS